MAFDNTKMASRFGLDLKFYSYVSGDVGTTPVLTVNFANEVSLDLSSDIAWATGGNTHKRMIGFNSPMEGTLTISTQIIPMNMIALVSGADLTGSDANVIFKNDSESIKPRYYTIEGNTVWVGEDGVSHAEKIIIHKACAKRGYNVTYTGDGDPQSIDVEFEVVADSSGRLVTFNRFITETDNEPPTPGGGGGNDDDEPTTPTPGGGGGNDDDEPTTPTPGGGGGNDDDEPTTPTPGGGGGNDDDEPTTPTPGGGGGNDDDEPTEIYLNSDGYIYYTDIETINDTYGHFNEDEFYDTPIVESPDETIFRDRNNLYIELFARDSTLPSGYKGEHYLCYSLDNSIFTDEYCHNKNIIMPNFAPNSWPRWNAFIESLNSENMNDLIVDCLDGDTPYQFITFNYDRIGGSTMHLIALEGGDVPLIIGGRNREDDFIPVDENDHIFNGCAYEVMRMDDFAEIYPQ